MNKRKKKAIIVALLMAMSVGQVLPSMAVAQPGGGVFCRGEYQAERAGTIRGNDHDGVFNVGNEPFGAAGSQIGNEPFGAPVGGGAILLVAASIGYAAIKSKQNKLDH